jgi:putative ABC transport system permease protein
MESKVPQPPRISERLLEKMANPGSSAAIIGDISEEFQLKIEEQGLSRARLWYCLFVLKCLPSFVRHSISWNLTMLKNYLTIALRLMKRHKAFSSINIAGLAVGMACSIMIGLFVVYESGYDHFHEKSGRIYRVYSDIVNKSGSWRGAWTPPPLAEALLQDFPEVEAATRFSPWPGETLISARGELFVEKSIRFADASFFAIFSYSFIFGDPSTALESPGTIVISRTVAEKYFGHDNPLGETMTFQGQQRDFKVTGVIEDPPPKSHLQFDMVASLVSTPSSAGTRWTQHTYFTYILLREGASAAALEAKFPQFARRHYGPQFFADTGMRYEDFFDKGDQRYGFRLETLTDIHLNKNVSDNLSLKGNTTYLKAFSAIAFFILLIACINFMNLATARFAHRSREVGIRKVLGSQRKQLVAQFLGESFLLSTIALVLALGAIAVMLPAFSRLARRPLVFGDILSGGFPFLLGGITLAVGLAAGSYPALFLSSFAPQTTIKGRLAVRGKGHILLRRALVLVQFAISFAVIFGAGVISRQVGFLRNQELGFDKDHVVVIHRANALGSSGDAFESELLAHPEILKISRSESLPGRHFNPNGHRLEGWPATEEKALMTTYVDQRFADALGLELAAGRFFSREVPTDATSAVVINERAARELGLSDPVGKRLHKEFGGAKEGEFVIIIGVLKDFHFASLHHEILPMLLRPLSPVDWELTSVKIRSEHLPRALALIEKTWKKFTGGQPFQYSFLDQDFGALYDSERRAEKIFLAFSALTILVACLGLYGLVSFAAEQRMREIGIRKTFGASVASLAGLLSREVIILVGISAVIASPPALYFAEAWLRNFAFRISIHPLMFAATGAAVLTVAFLSIGFRTVRAAAANPVDTLRYE